MTKTGTPAAQADQNVEQTVTPNVATPVGQAAADQTALEQQLIQAREAERRALADYQNLAKRNQEQQLKMVKFASRELLSALMQPLDHLDLAAAQLKDPGLDMVVKQFWQVLETAGVQEVAAVGQPVDPHTMEVVQAGDKKQKVTQVIRKGYLLHGELLQPAKVIID